MSIRVNGKDAFSGAEIREPEILGFGVMHEGWCVQFDTHKEANAFAAKHREKVRLLVPAKDLLQMIADERMTATNSEMTPSAQNAETVKPKQDLA